MPAEVGQGQRPWAPRQQSGCREMLRSLLQPMRLLHSVSQTLVLLLHSM